MIPVMMRFWMPHGSAAPSVSPSTGSLVITGHAPTINPSSNSISTGTGGLILSGHAPYVITGNFVISVNNDPWTSSGPDWINGPYIVASDDASTDYIHVVLGTNGVMSVSTNGSPVTPSPEEYQWIYQNGNPSNKPIPESITSLYEVNMSVFSYGGPPSTPSTEYWPWNWWYSKGAYTYAAFDAIIAGIGTDNAAAGGDSIGSWMDLNVDREWFFYVPSTSFGEPGYGYAQPIFMVLTVREKSNTSNNDSTYLKLALGVDIY